MATTVIDEEAQDVGTAPVLYAMQPKGKLWCKINYAGSEPASAFVVGGTLGGGAAQYFTVVKPADYPNEYWLACTALPVPDDAAGTVTFNGPTGLTTLNPTVVSSQGRPNGPSTGIWGLISTECWLRYKTKGKDRSDLYWNGVPTNADFPNGDFVVTSPTDLKNKLASLATGLGQKYRIQIQDLGTGAWNGSFIPSASKDFLVGGGYCVIESSPIGRPACRQRWFISQKMRGLEIRDIDHYGAPDGSNDDLNMSINATDNIVVLRNINFIDPEWVQDTSYNDVRLFVSIKNAECVRILGCKMYGGKRDIFAVNCHLLEIAYNLVSQTVDDFADMAFDGTLLGHWADDDATLWIHHNRVSNVMDLYTGLHLDFSQYSKTLVYPKGDTDYSSNYPATNVALGQCRLKSGVFFQCTTPGQTAFHATTADIPVPAVGGTSTDGTVEWTGRALLADMPKIWVIVHHNILLSGGQVHGDPAKSQPVSDHPGAQFLINSNAGAPWPMAVFNNFSATAQQRGTNLEASGQRERNFVEYNSFLGPHEQPYDPAHTIDYVDQIISTFGPFGKVRAYKNVCASVAANVFSEGNVVVKGKNPTAGKAYWDVFRATIADFTDPGDGVKRFYVQDDGLDTFDDTWDRLSKLFHNAFGDRVGARGREKHLVEFTVVDALGREAMFSQEIVYEP